MSKKMPPTCPVCGQENDATNRYCSFCGTRFDLPLQPTDYFRAQKAQIVEELAPEETVFSGNLEDLPSLTNHPFWGAIPVLGLLTILPLGFFFWGMAIDANDWPYAALLVFLLFLFTLLIFFGQLWSNVSQAKNFILSQRPLIRWRYRPDEWQQVRQAQLGESGEDMREMAGCAVPFFAGVGTLMGTVIGSVEGFVGAVPGAEIGAIAGYIFGKILVPMATGLNQSTNRELYRTDLPVWVVLAPGEIYYNRQYFRDDGMTDRIESITLEEGHPAYLRVGTYAVRGSILNSFDGNIPVPARMLANVQMILPELQKSLKRQD
ncbi:hypothetical protein IQ225_14605 [Synechocystis salina LEGE 06155]|nr:hypothetical protein [Synechocystis salina LEGE 06155]